jgi:cellobiose phosphorylase
MHIVTERDPDTGAIFARNGYQTDFPGRVAFFDVDVQAGGPEPTVCGDRGDFFGGGGTRAAPAALVNARLSGRLGRALKTELR